MWGTVNTALSSVVEERRDVKERNPSRADNISRKVSLPLIGVGVRILMPGLM